MLAILDWGIGGLGYYRRFKRAHPRAPVLYWSDAGYTPYGKVPRAALAARVAAVLAELKRRGATRCVIACNAASTVLGDFAPPLPATGIIAHAVRAARAARARRLGVVGGTRTVRSGVYRRALATPGRRVVQRVAQPLSAFIEAGELDAPRTLRALGEIVAPLRDCDALLLACTHYPALAPRFAGALPGVRLIDPVEALHAWVERNWRAAGAGAGADRFFTTGDPRAMARAGRAAFGVEIDPRRARLRDRRAPAR